MKAHINIAFFGSSLVSSYWNGAATYCRGIVWELARHAGIGEHTYGHRVQQLEELLSACEPQTTWI